MAPTLAQSQHNLIRDMLTDGSFTNAEIATAARCSARAVRRIRQRLDCFGATRAPPNGAGRPRDITPPMLSALLERLIEKPDMYLEEMAVFLFDEFDTLVTASTISKTLRRAGWMKKTARRITREQNADLRDYYLHKLSAYRSYHLVYVDKSGCNRRCGFRHTGWSPLGSTPTQTAKFHRGQRYQVLPAYTQAGVLFSQLFQGHTDAEAFEHFIEALLPHCGRFPEPKSVLVMDNASIHHTAKIRQMCDDAGVVLLYLPPYSPDLNPIEEFFAELKSFIKRHWADYETCPDFGWFLQ
ncbi:unnamed protein product, partial [Colletotrichum noveboracense]